jgi:hypothetical protein
MHAKDNPSNSSASTPRAKNNQDKRLKVSLTREQVVLCQNEAQRPQYISSK